jgi:hypothetical protein
MSAIIEFMIEPATQAVLWLICIIFAVLFARFVKRISFGEDTGTKAWIIIAIGLLFIGLRVSFKLIIPDFASSYDAQVARYLLGILGSTILLYGVYKYYTTVNNIYGGV